MGTKLYIKTFGCQINEYDSQKTVEPYQDRAELTNTVEGVPANINANQSEARILWDCCM